MNFLSKKAQPDYQVHVSNSLSHWINSSVKMLVGENPFSSTLICLENTGTQQFIELFLTQQQTVIFGSEFVTARNWIPKLFSLFSCFKRQQQTKEFLYSPSQFHHAIAETIFGMLTDSKVSAKYPYLINYLQQDELEDIPHGISPALKTIYPHNTCWTLAHNLTQPFYEASLESHPFSTISAEKSSDWKLLQKEVWDALQYENFFLMDSILPQIFYDLHQNTQPFVSSCHPPSTIIFIGPIPIYKKEIDFLIALSHFIPIIQVLLTPSTIKNERSSLGTSLLVKTDICLQHLASFNIYPNHHYFTEQTSAMTSILQKNPPQETRITPSQLCITRNPSIWKEVETVYEQILQEFQKIPSLQLQDIYILTTNLEEYGEFLSLTFLNKIPIKTVGSYGMRYSSICHALSDLFSLSTEKGYTGKIFDICTHECIQRSMSLGEEELSCFDFLRRTYPDIWGYSLKHQQENLRTHSPKISTLEKILQKLVRCLFEKDPTDVEDRLYKKSNQEIHLSSLGSVYAFFSNLEEDFSTMYLEKHTLVSWCQKTISLLKKYITPTNDEQTAEFTKIINTLSTVSTKSHQHIWPFGCFYQLLQKIFNEQQREFSHGNRGGINMGSIQNFSGIQTKIIFLIGVSENLFPPKQTISLDKKNDAVLLETFEFRNQLLYVLLGCQKIYLSYASSSSDQSLIIEEILWEITRLHNNTSHTSEWKESFIKSTTLTPPIFQQSSKNLHIRTPNFQEIENKLPSTIPIADLQDFLKNSVRSFFRKSLNIFLPKYSIWHDILGAPPKWDPFSTKINDLIYEILLKQIYNPGENIPLKDHQIEQINQIVTVFVKREIVAGELSERFVEIQQSLCVQKIVHALNNLQVASKKNNIDPEFWSNLHIFSLHHPTPKSNPHIQFVTPISIENMTLTGGTALYLKKGNQIIFILPFRKDANIISTLIYPSLFFKSVHDSIEISLLNFDNNPQKNSKNILYVPSPKMSIKQGTKKWNTMFLSNDKNDHIIFLETVTQCYLENYSDPKILYESMLWDTVTSPVNLLESPMTHLWRSFSLHGKEKVSSQDQILNPHAYPCPYGQRFTSFWGSPQMGHYKGWPETLLNSIKKILVNSHNCE